jgi:hypothetical protein
MIWDIIRIASASWVGFLVFALVSVVGTLPGISTEAQIIWIVAGTVCGIGASIGWFEFLSLGDEDLDDLDDEDF